MYKLALLGQAITKSLSPRIHQAFATQAGITITYECIECEKENLTACIETLIAAGYRGVNITKPLKENAFLLAQELTPAAKQVKSVNTLRFSDNSIAADNTDGVGFIQDVQQRLAYDFANKQILILGAGGAVRGLLAVLPQQQITIYNRTTETAARLLKDFPQISLSATAQTGFDVIIDARSTQEIPAGFQHFHFNPNSLAYDLKYGEAAQPFLAWAQAHGASKLSDGTGMLIQQAAKSFEFWTGIQVNGATCPISF
jgi:shikimate dehydrogenase